MAQLVSLLSGRLLGLELGMFFTLCLALSGLILDTVVIPTFYMKVMAGGARSWTAVAISFGLSLVRTAIPRLVTT